MISKTQSEHKLQRFAWAYYAYLLFVILFGAWVRITGSGAGCGKFWPTCHGEIIPLGGATKTLIEYGHRLSSGILGILTLALVLWVFRRGTPRARIAASLSLLLVLVEAAIGAGIVLRELVALDASVARATVVALHLANTLFLAAAVALTARWSSPAALAPVSAGRGTRLYFGAVLLLLVVLSMTGAVTALGDTLFPVSPTEGAGFFAHVRDDLAPAAHFLVRLRIVHPLLAVVVSAIVLLGLYALDGAAWLGPNEARWRKAALALVFAQLFSGVLSIALRAPGYMQLIHLLLAHAVWLTLVVLASAAFLGSQREPTSRY